MNFKLNRKSIFLVAWAIMEIYTLFVRDSEFKYFFSGNTMKYLCSGLAVMLLVCKMLYFDRFRKGQLLLMFSAMVLILIVSYKASGITLILSFLFIFAASGLQLEELVRLDMRIRISAIIILFVCSQLGIINSYSRLINGNLKLAFGWLHPNTFCGMVVLVLIEWLYLEWDRISLKHVALSAIVFLFLFRFAASRTTLYASVAVIMWVLFAKRKKGLLYNPILQTFYVWITPLMALISWIMYFLYVKGTAIGQKLNIILTTRLNWAYRFMTLYGVSLWGNDIETVSTRTAALTGAAKQILDMSYIRLPIEYGVVYTIFYLCAFVIITRFIVKNRQWRELMLVVYFSAIGIGSTASMNFFTNYMLLLLLQSLDLDVFQRKNCRTASEENVIRRQF